MTLNNLWQLLCKRRYLTLRYRKVLPFKRSLDMEYAQALQSSLLIKLQCKIAKRGICPLRRLLSKGNGIVVYVFRLVISI
jgi:hypothetical protein